MIGRTEIAGCLPGGLGVFLGLLAGLAVAASTNDSPTAEKRGDDAPSIPQSDVIKFKNGDSLHGTLLSVTTGNELRWRQPNASQMIVFTLDSVAEVGLAARASAGKQTSAQAVVRLTNGDELHGEIVSLDKDALLLRTWFAGPIAIKRVMVQNINPGVAAATAVYTGPTGLEGWTHGEDQPTWTYKKGAFYANTEAGIGRDVKIPDVARIEFHAAWRRMLNLQFVFCTDNIKDMSGGGYCLQLQDTYAYLQRGKSGEGFNNIGEPIAMEALQKKIDAQFVVMVNKPKKTICLLIDGQMVKQWNDTDESAGKGTGLMFYADGSEGALKISQIRVSEWDGKLSSDETLVAHEQDTVRLTNNDNVSGRIEGIAKNEITLVTSYGTLKVPTDRAMQIALADSKSQRARRQAGDVRAFLAEGGRITVALEKLDEKALGGSSENWGRLTCTMDALNKVQFNIYDQPSEGEEEDEFQSATKSMNRVVTPVLAPPPPVPVPAPARIVE